MEPVEIFVTRPDSSTSEIYQSDRPLTDRLTGAGILRNAESCQGVICGKPTAERSANYPLSLFRTPLLKNSAFPRIAKLPFARRSHCTTELQTFRTKGVILKYASTMAPMAPILLVVGGVKAEL